MIVSLPYSAKKLPLTLKMVGINHKQEPINRSIGLPVFQLFYCVKGKGEFISDHQCSVVTAGQCLLIYPNVSHIYQSLTPDWTVHFIGFEGSICSELLQALSMKSSGVYYLPKPDIFENVMIKFKKILRAAKPDREILFSTACYQFLLELSGNINYIHPSELVCENQILQMILSYLEKNYSSPVSLADLSAITHRSKEHLCSLFKKEMNQTIMHYLIALRIQHAKIYLIQYPEKNISEISRMCGFESPSYFGSTFRKFTGTTPDNYRKSV